MLSVHHPLLSVVSIIPWISGPQDDVAWKLTELAMKETTVSSRYMCPCWASNVRLKACLFLRSENIFSKITCFVLTKNNNWAVVMCCVVCDLKWDLANRVTLDPLWAAMQRSSFFLPSVYNPEWVSGSGCWYMSKNISCILIIFGMCLSVLYSLFWTTTNSFIFSYVRVQLIIF
jgi:hypothetical protein